MESSKTAFRIGMLAITIGIIATWLIRPTNDFAAGLVAGVRIGLGLVVVLVFWRSLRLQHRT